jgi:hypothetical protein
MESCTAFEVQILRLLPASSLHYRATFVPAAWTNVLRWIRVLGLLSPGALYSNRGI